MARARRAKNEYSGAAVIYARYSSHNQRDVSIEQQVEKCQDFASRNNLRVVEVYSDRAISGKTDQRPNFQRMMREAKTGRFGCVIAWKSNRMGRNMLEAMINDARLAEQGIRCLYVEEDFDDTAAGRFALRNMMNVNQFYSENMAEDVMRGMMDNASKCLVNGPLPYGFKRGEDGRFAIDQKRAAVVREIFERFAAGEYLMDIERDLNARGIESASGGPWRRNSCQRMIANERYAGVYLYNGIRIEDGIPAIVGKELFYEVQKRLKEKKNPRGRHRVESEYLLTGKLFCGYCGGNMVGMSGTSKSAVKHYYYDCQTKRQKKTCRKKAVRRDWIEFKVAEAVKAYIMTDDVIQWLLDGYEAFMAANRKDSLLLSYESNLEGVKSAIKNVMAAIEQGIITPTTRGRLLELEEEQRNLEAMITLERAALKTVPRNEMEFWLNSFREGDVTDRTFQEDLINSFVRAVYLYDDKMKIVCNYTGKRDDITISLSDVDGLAESGPECSYNCPAGSPNKKRLVLTSRFSLSKKSA